MRVDIVYENLTIIKLKIKTHLFLAVYLAYYKDIITYKHSCKRDI